MVISHVLLFAGDEEDSIRAGYYMRVADNYFKQSEFDSSLFYFQKAGDIWEYEKAAAYLQTRIGISNSLLRKGDYNGAKDILMSSEKMCSEAQFMNCVETGTIYTLLGYCYLIREEFDKADIYVSKSLKIFSENFGENHESAASAYYTSGLMQKAKGDYAASISFLKHALTIQQSIPEIAKTTVANTLTVIGSVYDDINEFELAITYYQKADSVYLDVGQQGSTQAASCYLNLMSSYNNKGDYRDALLYGRKVIEIYTALSLPEHPNMASALSKLGEVYTNLGDYEKASEYLTRSLVIFTTKHAHKKSAIGAIYQRLGDIYNKIGNYEKAISYSEQGITLYKQSLGEYHPQAGFMYELLADAYVNAKQYDQAILSFNKALIARHRVDDSSSRNDIALIHTALANVYILREQFDSAKIHLKTASEAEDVSLERNIPQMALLRKRYGDFYFQQKNYPAALQYYHESLLVLSQTHENVNARSIPDLSQGIFKKEMLNVILCKARTFEKLSFEHDRLGNLQMAFEYYQKGMDELDDLRRKYSSDASKFYLSEIGASLYRSGCRSALTLYSLTKERHYQEQAFLIADRSKGNILLERLFDSEAKHFAGIPDSLLKYEQELLASIAHFEKEISGIPGQNSINHDASFSEAQSRYLNAKNQHQEFIELLEQRYPKYYKLKYARYSLSLKQLQDKLESHTVLAEYMLDDSVIYLFAVTQNSLRVKTIPNISNLRSVTNRFSASLKTYDSRAYCKSGYELYVALLRPITTMINLMTKLVIIPDGYLYYIPFEALPTKLYSQSVIDFTAMNFVLSDCEVRYSYSAAFDLKSGKHETKNNSAGSSFIGFAPVFKDTTKNANFFANRTYVQQSGLSDVRSITLDGKTFNELKYSENEIVSIEQTLKQQSKLTKNFLFDSATEKNFKTFAPLYDIVHVATHGFINETNPKFSALLFSQPKTLSEDEDGILYVNEAYNLNLKAQLVVLSSCESGIGSLIDGEGMIALSRGLFYAGAKNIIFSLWKVSDKQTYHLMDEFYKNIALGKTFSSSLRSAKLSMIRSKESAFPGKWSGFVLIGQ